MIWATMGGVTVGFAILARFLATWWPGRKALMSKPLDRLGPLLPFLLAWCYGTLAVLSLGGLVGLAADLILWASNWLGDAALVLGVGGSVGVVSKAGVYLPLTAQGSGVLLILTLVVLVVMKKVRSVKMGVWCGVCLGVADGIAGFAAVPLANAANEAGALLYGAVA